MEDLSTKNPCDVWGIKRTEKGRYVLIDTISGKILDDLQGHGCATYTKAYNYGYQKFHSKGMCADGQPNVDKFNSLF